MPLQYPPKGRWRSLPFGTKCPSLAFALDNQDMPHNSVQQSVILTTKLDALTLVFCQILVEFQKQIVFDSIMVCDSALYSK
ncbi:MAG: hypothetical protein HRU34_03855, partial [Richelia sp.]|nr:hypothetical protein [Richelia sp.]